MPKYKNNTPQIVEGFLEKMFGAIATSTGKKVAAKMAKKDPEVGKLLSRAADLVSQAEKRLKGKSKSEKEKHFADLEKDLGW
jgi:hypothetical protein